MEHKLINKGIIFYEGNKVIAVTDIEGNKKVTTSFSFKIKDNEELSNKIHDVVLDLTK